ncbi:MAG: hypothetical protein HFG73_01575 [Hungatella sp.]|nr:hypothetical protein [Hungatella sp.]
MKRQLAGVLCGLMIAGAGAMTVQADDWAMSENGKNWMYMYAPDDPAKDEWIEVEGKVYYLDSKGYMKTGWVTNKDDGKKYYMGPDGAMAFNTFSANDRYVGPDGTGVDGYDKYRKAARSELKLKNTSKGKKAAAFQGQQYFLMTDLNGDGYRDVVVAAGNGEPESIVKIAVWDPETAKFQLAAESDADQGTKSTLYLDPEGEEVWLEITEASGDMRLFQMKYDTTMFENAWTFTMESDEDGIPRYYVNEEEEDRERWEFLMARARQERGSTPITGYVPVTEENIKAQVDVVLGEKEVDMWR